MKFGQFMSYYNRKNFFKQYCEKFGLQGSSKPFYVYYELSANSIGNEIFERNQLYSIYNILDIQ